MDLLDIKEVTDAVNRFASGEGFAAALGLALPSAFVVLFAAFGVSAVILNYHWSKYEVRYRTALILRLTYVGGGVILLGAMAVALVAR
jgi:ABC-type multidrug transport system permease subunit